MNRWMTISEIAAARLPGLPRSRQGVAARADREGWAARKGLARARLGAGGGLEFAIDILPPEARAALARRAMQPANTQRIPVAGADRLPAAEQHRRDARLWVLAAVDDFARENGLKLKPASLLWAAAYNAGTIGAPEWVRAQVARASRTRMDSWRKARAETGDDVLGQDDRGRRSLLDEALDGEVRTACLAVMAAKPFIRAAHLRAFINDRFKGQLDRSPSLRDCQRAMARWEIEYRNELLRLRDPDGYRSRVEFAAVGATRAARLNELWQIDASPADVMLKGKRRHSIYLAIDIFSRRTKVLVTETPRASAVGALMRKCILDWGLPERVKTDNGSDFKAHATTRLLGALGIETEVSPPYDPKTKGNVERAIGTFQADLAACPGYIGRSVAQRKVLENRKAFNQRLGADEGALFEVEMDLAEFQRWCDEWTDTVYAHRAHGGLRGQTPFLRAASYREPIRQVEDPRALDILLAPVAGGGGLRKVTKSGVRVDGNQYYTADAAVGTWVLVRMDPLDLGRVLLFADDGEAWIGEGICPELAGRNPVEVAVRMKAAHKEIEREGLKEIRREMRRLGPRDVSDAILAEGRERAASVHEFPKPVERFSTPAMRAAVSAVMADQPAATQAVPDLAARRAAVVAGMAPRPSRAPETPQQRFRRALALEAELRAGRTVDPADEAWLTTYQRQPQYQAQRMIFDDLGMAMFA